MTNKQIKLFYKGLNLFGGVNNITSILQNYNPNLEYK